MIDSAGTNHFVTLMILFYELQLYSKNRYLTYKGGGRVLPFMLRYMYVPVWRVWFSSSLLWDRVYKSEGLGLESGIIFQDTDQLFKDFSLDKGDQWLPIKNDIMQICGYE